MGKSMKRSKTWDDEFLFEEHIEQRRKNDRERRRVRRQGDPTESLGPLEGPGPIKPKERR